MTNSKQKGKRGELRARDELRRLFGCQARRGQQFNGADGSADVETDLDLHFEVKATERLRIHEAIEQAKGDARDGKVPVVLYKARRRPWLVILELDSLPALASVLAQSEGSEDEHEKES